jgi:hypothetical protein
LAQWRLPLPFMRGSTFQIFTSVSAGYCRHCAKPQVVGSALYIKFVNQCR